MTPVFTNHARERVRELYGDRTVEHVWQTARPVSPELVAGLTQRRMEGCRDSYHLTDDDRGILVETDGRIITVIRLGITARFVLRPPAKEPVAPPVVSTPKTLARQKLGRQLSELLGRTLILSKDVDLTGVKYKAVSDQLESDDPGVILETNAVTVPTPGGYLRFFVCQTGHLSCHTVKKSKLRAPGCPL